MGRSRANVAAHGFPVENPIGSAVAMHGLRKKRIKTTTSARKRRMKKYVRNQPSLSSQHASGVGRKSGLIQKGQLKNGPGFAPTMQTILNNGWNRAQPFYCNLRKNSDSWVKGLRASQDTGRIGLSSLTHQYRLGHFL
ncbi:MAG: hypothetical protein ACMUHX_05035 [bacterium]